MKYAVLLGLALFLLTAGAIVALVHDTVYVPDPYYPRYTVPVTVYPYFFIGVILLIIGVALLVVLFCLPPENEPQPQIP